MGLAGDILQMNIGQIFQTPAIPTADFTGQTIVITGGNTGLGFEAAKHFYSRNASHLILACRDKTKGERARREILASSGASPSGKVEVWELDMAKHSSVLAFGDRLDGLPRIDALLANAGIDVNHWEVFEDAESTLTVNVVSTFLVAMLAIPKLQHTAAVQRRASHLVFTGSVVHIFAKDKHVTAPPAGSIFQTLNDAAAADMADRYHLSKLLVLMGARRLAERLTLESEQGRAPVVVNCVNPGWCKTELFRTRDGGLGGRVGLRLLGRTAEEGSRTLVHAAAAGEASHGRYLSECRVKPESTFMRSDAAAAAERRVWTELLGMLEKIRPGVTVWD